MGLISGVITLIVGLLFILFPGIFTKIFRMGSGFELARLEKGKLKKGRGTYQSIEGTFGEKKEQNCLLEY